MVRPYGIKYLAFWFLFMGPSGFDLKAMPLFSRINLNSSCLEGRLVLITTTFDILCICIFISKQAVINQNLTVVYLLLLPSLIIF